MSPLRRADPNKLIVINVSEVNVISSVINCVKFGDCRLEGIRFNWGRVSFCLSPLEKQVVLKN
jgi:hypothetical protein